jgi:hypothetical protein
MELLTGRHPPSPAPVARPLAPSPRLLTLEQAAAYLSLPKAEMQRLGLGLVRLGLRQRYDKNAIDAQLDRLSGLESSETANVDDCEAALERFLEGVRDASRRS